MSGDAHDIKKEVKKYYFVFFALLVLSVLTVGASYVNVGVALGVAIALTIATVKSSLVASFFMHLITEKKLVFISLLLTVFFFAGMMSLFIGAYYSVPQGTLHLEKHQKPKQEQAHHEEQGGPHVP
jgi:caa(3)-type oxidase subunit IV